MATHRRVRDVSTPAELRTFHAEDWPGDDGPDATWFPAFCRWRDARRAWAEQHPGAVLGDLVDMLHTEVRTQLEMMRRHPLDPVGRVFVRDRVVVEGVVDPVGGMLRGQLPGEEEVFPGTVGIRHCDWLH